MAPPKHRLSDVSVAGHRTKMPRQSQNDDAESEAPPEDCFTIEVKLRSTSKAERNDPKPPEYYRDLIKKFRDEDQNHTKGNVPSDGASPAASAGGSDAKLSEAADLHLLVHANLLWRLSLLE
jgi:hypothetical protein